MAGPGFVILMRDPLTTAQRRDLDAWLRTFAISLETDTDAAGELNSWYFRVDDASTLGLLDGSQYCPIGLALVDPSREMYEDEQEQMMLRLGFWPRHGINVYAMCKYVSTGRVTGSLILRLMERYDGYLDFCTAERVPKRVPPEAEEE